jgi:glycosyltransferase involved in cell wall biosynthesis
VKIIHILGDSKFGGAAKSIVRLALLWQRLKWDARILSTDRQFQDFAAASGVATVAVDCVWREIRPLRDLVGLFRLWRYLRAEGFSVVHTHTTKAGFVGRIAARLAGVPVVVHTVHGFAFHEQSSAAKIAFYTVLEWIAGWFCHCIITVSEFHRDWALRLRIASPEKIVAIPNGIPDGTLGHGASRDAMRRTLGLLPEDVFLFTPGRVAQEKGLEELLMALSLLPAEVKPHVQAFIAGDGPLLTCLERRVAELGIGGQVRFLGFRSDIFELLAACDIVALPSWREGLSISLLESMCAGRAIVASSIGSNREALDAGGPAGPVAQLVDAGDVPALAAAIGGLAADPALREDLGRRARALWESRYSADKSLAHYERTYVELLRRRGHLEEPATAIPAESL